MILWVLLFCASPNAECVTLPVAYGSERTCREAHRDGMLVCQPATWFACKDDGHCQYEFKPDPNVVYKGYSPSKNCGQ